MTLNSPRFFPPNNYINFLIFMMFLGFLLRLWGVHFGLPYLYGPAEHYTVNNAISFGRGSIVPLSSAYPPLYAYILFLLYSIYFVSGYLLGYFPTINDFALSFYIDPSPFYLIGRATTALIGAATIPLVYLLGAKAFDRKTALVGAIFLSVTFLHVKYSHYIRPDIPMTFLMVLTVLFLFYYLEKKKLKYLLIGGFVAGLAVSTKYTALLLVFPIFVAHLLYIFWGEKGKERKDYLKPLILGYLSMILGFIVSSPYMLSDFLSFWRGFAFMIFGFNRWDVSFLSEAYNYTVFLFSENGLGMALGITSVAGIFVAIFREPRDGILLLSFPVFYFIMMSRSMALLWYIIPLLPFLSLFAARLVTFVFDREALSRKTQTILTSAAVFILILHPLYMDIKFDYWISKKDTRTIAKEWVEENLPETAKLLVDNYGPPLKENKESLLKRWGENLKSSFEETFQKSPDMKRTRNIHHEYTLKALSNYDGKRFNMVQMTHPYWKRKEGNPDLEVQKKARKTETSPLSAEYYERNDFDYFITASYMYERYFTEEGRKNFPSSFKFYSSVEKRWRLIKVFKPHPLKRPGPVIKVFKIPGAYSFR